MTACDNLISEQRPVAAASSIYMEEGALSIPIGMTGEGSQALFRLIDNLERGPQILVIEEPETHLHPAFVKKAWKCLENAGQQGKQLFLSTHSPFLVDQSSLENIYVVRSGENGTVVTPMGNRKDLRDLLLDMGMRPSDILFHDAVLLVEGLSDEIFVNGLSNAIDRSLTHRHVKIVRSNGKSRGRYKIEFWAEVAFDASLPLYMLLDNDAAAEAEEAINKGLIDRDRCLILSQGDLEDHYPRELLQEALSSLYDKDVEEAITSGSRVRQLRTLLRGRRGNIWKVELAEEMVRLIAGGGGPPRNWMRSSGF